MARIVFRHLSLEEREHLSLGLAQGMSLRHLAQELGRSPSTLSREVRRNQGWQGYRASTAERKARIRARVPRRPRKLASGWLWRYVEARLYRQWSPRQIALSLKRSYPGDMSQQVSHETIYATIYAYPRGEIKRDLLKQLRQARKWRRSRGKGKDRRGQIPNMVSIHDRPAEVESRKVPGHWEGDLIKGTNRGKEMTAHERLSKQLKIDIYFADPRSPWQRATCENTNGLIRQYFPKGTNLVPVTQRELNFVANRLNTRPREGLGGMTPLEAWDELCQGVASES